MEDNIKKVEGISEKSRKTRNEQVRGLDYSSTDREYLDYIERVYGSSDASVNFFESLLSHNGIQYLPPKNEVGVINNPKPKEALEGTITTNLNNSNVKISTTVYDSFLKWGFTAINSGELNNTDTKLGIIANNMYSNMLYKSAVEGSRRGRNLYQGNVGEHPYITPYLFYKYGNNLSTFENLSDIMPLDVVRGIAVNNFNDNTKVMYYENVDQRDNGNYVNIMSQFGMYLHTHGKYVEGNPEIGLYDDRTTKQVLSSEPLNYKISSKSPVSIGSDLTQHFVYNDVDIDGEHIDTDSQFDNFDVITESNNNSGIVKKTSELFKKGKLKSLIGGFSIEDGNSNEEIDSVLDPIFGHSRGRNLFIKNPTSAKPDKNGFKNPYCRSWTYHHQYDRYTRAIRPFSDGEKAKPLNEIQEVVKNYRSKVTVNKNGKEVEKVESGGEYLSKYSVLRNNGFVKIGMFDSDLTNDNKGIPSPNIQKYMLSIENLAWKDFPKDIERHRKGPNGGRIMWFPPYDLDFQENVNVQWDEKTFIGRGENMYSYVNTKRGAQLSFVILIDHPIITNYMAKHAGEEQTSTKITTPDDLRENPQDPDGDILRYFAGCDTFKFIEDDNIKENDFKKYKQTEGLIDPTTGEGEKIKFAVFFPNNYSGMGPKGDSKLEDDLFQYLITGINTCVSNSSGDSVGYEINTIDNLGISRPNMSQYSDCFISACDVYSTKNKGQCAAETESEGRKFYYRVDYDLRQNNLTISGDTTSYQDNVSFGLNADIKKVNSIKHFHDNNYTFLEFVLAYIEGFGTGGQKNLELIRDKAKDILSEQQIDSRVKPLGNMLKRGIENIKVQGGATQQDKKNSSKLAKRRAENTLTSLKDFLGSEKVAKTDTKILEPFTFSGPEENIENSKDIDTLQAKYQRCAQVVITLKTQDIDSVGNIDEQPVENMETEENIFYNSEDIANGYGSYTDETGETRSGYEYEYFKELDVTDPFIFKQIKSKYSYFDPAFHSLSPEGFNARLNFLHQCTRQGHTISASEVGAYAGTAGNLSFGRMPVCVVRIGDFINSRAIIESMSIQYSTDGIKWDLNPEGIGVQPMYAKVSLNIILIGGSALNYPVNRLQNAQTFDYYANTGVYDPRADRVTMSDKGDFELKYTHIFEPSFEKKK